MLYSDYDDIPNLNNAAILQYYNTIILQPEYQQNPYHNITA